MLKFLFPGYYSVKKWSQILDIEKPGWHNKIDTSTLDLHSCRDCILGQVFEEEAIATNIYGTGYGHYVDRNPVVTFIPIFTYNRYKSYWVAEITKRREQARKEQLRHEPKWDRPSGLEVGQEEVSV